MCAVSMIGDHYRDKWGERDWYPGSIGWPAPAPAPIVINQPQISRAEFDKLREEVAEMKALLVRAKKYDEETGQRDCEIDEKMDLLRKVAKLVGINLDDVLGAK